MKLIALLSLLVIACTPQKSQQLDKPEKAVTAIKEIPVEKTPEVPCKKNQTLDCLNENSSDLYQRDYVLYFKIFDDYASAILGRCDIDKGAEFLMFVATQSGFSSEEAEAVHGYIEKSFIDNSSCVADILLTFNDFSLSDKIIDYLRKPLFNRPEKLKPIIEKLKSNSKYKKLFR